MPAPASPELTALVRRHAAAVGGDDPLTARRTEAEYARRFWSGDHRVPAGLDDGLAGAFHDVRRNAALALGMDKESHDSAMAWAGWALSRGDGASALRARARLVLDEAIRWARHVDDGTGAADIADVPLLGRIVNELPGREGDPRPAAEPAPQNLVDAALRVEEAATLVRRPDIAAPLANWLRDQSEAPGAGNLVDAVTLMDARTLRTSGDLPSAARMCAGALEQPLGDPVTSTIKFRLELADYSILAGHDDTAARFLREAADDAAAAGLPLQWLTAVRAAIPVFHRVGAAGELRDMARELLASLAGMPESPAIRDVRAAAG